MHHPPPTDIKGKQCVYLWLSLNSKCGLQVKNGQSFFKESETKNVFLVFLVFVLFFNFYFESEF